MRNTPRRLGGLAALGLALVTTGLWPLLSSASPSAATPVFTNVDPYGYSAPADGGGRIAKLADGSTFRLHADDALLDLGVAPIASSEPQSDPVCGTTNVTWFFYAAPSDMSAATYNSRYSGNIDRIRGYVRQMNHKIYARSLSTSPAATPRPARLRVMCASSAIRIGGVHLSMDSAHDSFTAITNDLIAKGFNSTNYPNVKFEVFLDDPPLVTSNGITCGLGQMPSDESNSASNGANSTTYAVVWGNAGGTWQPCWHDVIALHELMHGMGAVGNGAPHGTGAGHCTDGYDVMCYDDHGPRGSSYTTGACAGNANDRDTWTLDCKDDDYFDTFTDPTDTYLSTHWNVGRNINHFLQFG